MISILNIIKYNGNIYKNISQFACHLNYSVYYKGTGKYKYYLNILANSYFKKMEHINKCNRCSKNGAY